MIGLCIYFSIVEILAKVIKESRSEKAKIAPNVDGLLPGWLLWSVSPATELG